MRLRVLVLFGLSMGLLVFQPHHPVSGLPIEGSTYYYQISNRRSVQENLGETFISDQRTSCQITILQVILIGNRYHVTFSGYRDPNNYVLTNSSVEISSNLIAFDLIARDYDGNNRSSYTRIENSPNANSIEACEVFLVNPDWTAHESTWNYSVEQIASHRCVNHALTLVYHSGRGEFQYSIVVNVEGYATISGENSWVNGTTILGLYCSYDVDGVLLQHSVSSSSHYYDDFNQVTHTSSVTITRMGPGVFLEPAYPFVIYQILLAMITLLVGLGCGFWLGKRQREIRT